MLGSPPPQSQQGGGGGAEGAPGPFTALAAMTDEDIQRVHPAHNRQTIAKVLLPPAAGHPAVVQTMEASHDHIR